MTNINLTVGAGASNLVVGENVSQTTVIQQQQAVTTDGGANIRGNVTINNGTFVGRDSVNVKQYRDTTLQDYNYYGTDPIETYTGGGVFLKRSKRTNDIIVVVVKHYTANQVFVVGTVFNVDNSHLATDGQLAEIILSETVNNYDEIVADAYFAYEIDLKDLEFYFGGSLFRFMETNGWLRQFRL